MNTTTNFLLVVYYFKLSLVVNMIIILLGLPGSGKTSVGKYLATSLSYNWIDVDDHLLEPAWSCSVAAKLKELGSVDFLKEEGRVVYEAVKTFKDNTIISLTGSNPLCDKTMTALKVKIPIPEIVHFDLCLIIVKHMLE